MFVNFRNIFENLFFRKTVVSCDAYEYKFATLYQYKRLSVSSRPTYFTCNRSVLALTRKQHVYLVSLSLDTWDYPKLGTVLILGEMGVRILLI
jgi:hypothetical protein